ncbi:MAG: amidohydrolase [Ignavibacteria bacterium]|nr:amidohydrolase [Ignavibacteria bacterium]
MKNKNSILFTNCKVWQPEGRFDESFGINNGIFDFAGLNKEAAALAGNYKQTINLNGKLVLPAFTDGHLHLVNGALMLKHLDCSQIKSIDELKNTVNEYVKIMPDKWIIGGNLDINSIINKVSVKNENIADTIYSEAPLFIANYDYHSALCNSKALDISGINKKSRIFRNAELDYTSSGKLSGIISEGAMNEVYTAIPEPQLNEKVTAVKECINKMHQKGLTSISDITLPKDIEVYNELYKTGNLNLRINSYLPFAEFENIAKYIDITKSIDTEYFSIKGFKAFWDGALGSETALFSRNYNGKNHNGYKTELANSGKIYELAKKIDDAGYRIIIHAIGNKAVTEVLNLYENLPNTKKLRHRIEHAQHIDPADYERFGKIGVIASVQPIHLKYDVNTVKEKLPSELVPNTHNYYQTTKTGGKICFGTDFPIAGFDPIENIRLAVTRKIDSTEFTPEHKIPLDDCIKASTINNAYSNGNENLFGSITNGKKADFIVLNKDIFEAGFNELSVDLTYCNGICCFKSMN